MEASHFDAGTCYVTFDGHRTDDHKPYVFVTADYGRTWKSVASNLPTGNVNVIREDPKNANLLYLGTEYAFYVSLNKGGEWKRFMNGLPTVRIDDILVHARDNDLIVATHGRSIWIVDDVTALQKLSEQVTSTDVTLFEPRSAIQWMNNDIQRSITVGGQKNFRGENPQRGTAISYYLKTAPSDVKITISDYSGKVVRTFNACGDPNVGNCATKAAGLNRVQWTLNADPPAGAQQAQAGRGGGGGGGGGGGRGGFGGLPVEPGFYNVTLTVNGKEYKTRVMVEPDPALPTT